MTHAHPRCFDRLVVVSYRLPFRLFRNKVVRNAGGLVSAVLALTERPEARGQLGQKNVWVARATTRRRNWPRSRNR
jgi:hypothetical protein